MAALTFAHDGQQYEITYDQYGDVLYVVSAKSRIATRTIDDDNGIQWRFWGDEPQAAGFTIFDFDYCWSDRSSELHEQVLNVMKNNRDLADQLTKNIYMASHGGAMTVDESLARLGISKTKVD